MMLPLLSLPRIRPLPPSVLHGITKMKSEPAGSYGGGVGGGGVAAASADGGVDGGVAAEKNKRSSVA